MKIGIIAGAFDPMHSGHLGFINESVRQYDLDEVLVLVEKKSKHKQSFADFEHRKKIVELSIADSPKIRLYEPASDSFPLSSTVPKIKSEFDAEFYLLLGDDVGKHIWDWPDAKALFKDVELIVADRSQGRYGLISSGRVREQIKTGQQQVDMQEAALDYCRLNGLYG